MENMDAMHYEIFIRRVHQVGRSGTAGANADEYRRLERAKGHFLQEKKLSEEGKPKQWSKSLNELENDYALERGKISTYINSAIATAIKKYESKLSEEQIKRLEELKTTLRKPSMENIEKAIIEADKILLSIGLYPQ